MPHIVLLSWCLFVYVLLYSYLRCFHPNANDVGSCFRLHTILVLKLFTRDDARGICPHSSFYLSNTMQFDFKIKL